jgi:hypothetical protein
MQTEGDTHLWVSFAFPSIVPMGLRAPAGGVLRGVYKAARVILEAFVDENCSVDTPGGGLVESPSASDFSEAPVFGGADSGRMRLDSGIDI